MNARRAWSATLRSWAPGDATTSDAHHDSGYKYLFSHAELVRELLDTFVRRGGGAILDYATLRRWSPGGKARTRCGGRSA